MLIEKQGQIRALQHMFSSLSTKAHTSHCSPILVVGGLLVTGPFSVRLVLLYRGRVRKETNGYHCRERNRINKRVCNGETKGTYDAAPATGIPRTRPLNVCFSVTVLPALFLEVESPT